MNRAVPIFVALMIAASSHVLAEVIEVPLPTLQGWYGIDGVCVCYGDAYFQLGRKPNVINGVSLRLSGTVHVGQYTCDFGTGPNTYPFRFYFSASMWDTVSGYPWGAHAYSPEESGEFEVLAPFRQFYHWPATWEFLLAGYGRVYLTASPEGIFTDCDALDWPSATIEDAVLMIDGEFEVSVDQSTWGSIKALFQ
jgi:hypothetical protein